MNQVTAKTFIEHSREIALRFLQTVVAVDDQLLFTSKEKKEAEDYNIVKFDDASGLGSSNENSDIPTPQKDLLNYQLLSLSFASKGIICSGFTPSSTTKASLAAIINSSTNADVTILDWKMDGTGTDGQLATEAIMELARNDIAEGGRLRLITIYTGEDAGIITTELNEKLENEFNSTSIKNSIKLGKPGLSHWKLQVINKNDKNEEQLVDSLIDSFTELTAGLLSNAALSSIADIRDKTHNILHKFNKSLDPAYLSHVLGLISSPDMREQAHDVAFDYAVDLISEELKSELQISTTVKSSLSKEILESWPHHVSRRAKADRFRMRVGSKDPISFNNEIMKKLLSATQKIDLEEVLVKELKMEDEGELSAVDFFNNNAIQLTFDSNDNKPLLELCSLENTRRDVSTLGDHMPVLKQGAIIKNMADNVYYICIQPVCDSVRLSGESCFSFMQIIESTRKFSHVIRNQQGHLKLDISPVPKNIRTFTFNADKELKMICAKKDTNEKHIFIDNSRGIDHCITFEWCGELKQAVSQSIVNSLAAQLSRVGLDSFEWLRQRQRIKL